MNYIRNLIQTCHSIPVLVNNGATGITVSLYRFRCIHQSDFNFPLSPSLQSDRWN